MGKAILMLLMIGGLGAAGGGAFGVFRGVEGFRNEEFPFMEGMNITGVAAKVVGVLVVLVGVVFALMGLAGAGFCVYQIVELSR